MKLIVDNARFKLLLICLLAQPLHSAVAAEPEDGDARDSVQLVATSAPAAPSGTSAAKVNYNVPAKANSVATSVPKREGRTATALAHPHPLEPLLALANDAAARIDSELQDYTCTLVKRERVDGKLLPQETLFAKVRRSAPASNEGSGGGCHTQLYLRFEAPGHLSGREILFPCPESADHLLVRNGGSRLAFVTLQLTPTCPLAMRGNRYPVTEFGIERLVQRMIELGEKELIHDECEVTIKNGINVDGRSCQSIEVLHPVPREHFIYHIARIYVDDELQFPIRFEAYDWPTEQNGEPELIEDYTYRNLQINVGLTTDDFRRDHPAYKFSRR